MMVTCPRDSKTRDQRYCNVCKWSFRCKELEEEERENYCRQQIEEYEEEARVWNSLTLPTKLSIIHHVKDIELTFDSTQLELAELLAVSDYVAWRIEEEDLTKKCEEK